MVGIGSVTTTCTRTVEFLEAGYLVRTECDDGSEPDEFYLPANSGDSLTDAAQRAGVDLETRAGRSGSAGSSGNKRAPMSPGDALAELKSSIKKYLCGTFAGQDLVHSAVARDVSWNLFGQMGATSGLFTGANNTINLNVYNAGSVLTNGEALGTQLQDLALSAAHEISHAQDTAGLAQLANAFDTRNDTAAHDIIRAREIGAYTNAANVLLEGIQNGSMTYGGTYQDFVRVANSGPGGTNVFIVDHQAIANFVDSATFNSAKGWTKDSSGSWSLSDSVRQTAQSQMSAPSQLPNSAAMPKFSCAP